MKITMRKANSQGHTLGYKIGGKWRSRKEAVDLALAGKIEGVHVCRGEYGHYIQTSRHHYPKLYDLEVKLV
jgi:hypothetical protein